MTPARRRLLFWLWGPALGLSLLLAVLLHNTGSNLFVMAFAAALGFGVIAPLAELLLTQLGHFRGRRIAIVVAAFVAVGTLLLLIFAAGVVRAG